MNNACPDCGAIYAVAEKDIGRRIACKKCGAALVVADEGLTRDEVDEAPPPRREDAAERERSRGRDLDEDRPRRRDEEEERPRKKRDLDDEPDEKPRKPRGPGVGEYFNKIKGATDIATWLYGIGLFLTIYSYFSPQIDAAKIAGRDGDLMQAKTEDAADERDTRMKNDGKPSESDIKDREKRAKENAKDGIRLVDKKAYAEASAKQYSWWNVMIRLIGFVILAVGSIAYFTGDNSQLKRILGGVTILLILLAVIGGSVGLNVRAG